MKRAVNLTSHDATLIRGQEHYHYPKTQKELRLSHFVDDQDTGQLYGPESWFTISWLPPLHHDSFYLVSDTVRSNIKWRPDFMSPALMVKGSGQKIIGCRRFVHNQGAKWWRDVTAWTTSLVLFYPTIRDLEIAQQKLAEGWMVYNVVNPSGHILHGGINIPNEGAPSNQLKGLKFTLPIGDGGFYLGSLPRQGLPKEWQLRFLPYPKFQQNIPPSPARENLMVSTP